MKRILLVLAILILAITAVGCASSNVTEPRGKYVYDDANRLSTESLLAISSRLWQIDTKTNYELVVVLPKVQMTEEETIAWFNEHGVGKKDKNNGAAIFVYPDNSWFVSIGQGNDAISVPYSKTYGDKILTSEALNSDLSLSLIRYVEALRTQVTATGIMEIIPAFWETLKPNIPMILLWVLCLALLLLLVQQKDGFQPRDLIASFVVVGLLGIFLGISAISSNTEASTYNGYGIITNSQHSTHDWIEMRAVTVSNGKSSYTYYVPVPHTDYINKTALLDYDIRDYAYTFKTTDNDGAWDYTKGMLLELTIGIKSNELYSVHGFNDNSGGKTIGDGVASR